MSNELIMNVTPGETRIARLENGTVAELFVERAGEQQIAGNIYKGVVTRVLPGMQAAFVDIGLEKAAFLYVSDVAPNTFEDEEEDDEEEESDGDNSNDDNSSEDESSDSKEGDDQNSRQSKGRGRGGRAGGRSRKPQRRRRRGPLPKIETLVKEGQHIIVQVAKDPIHTKGARVTCHLSFPGRYVVAMPTVEHVGVSRRIGSYDERRRLRDILKKSAPPKMGFIARTNSAGATEEGLIEDMEELSQIWGKVSKKMDKAKPPSLVYQDLNLLLRSVRDLMSPEIDRLVIDSEEDYEEVMKLMDRLMPNLANRVELYSNETPLFDVYGVETEINRALGKKVWLKSGGYLVIDQNEALTSIDVNTGRFVGRDNFEDTILQNNLEAAEEIAYQLRLRNIGGIIINDFIDMERYSNRQKVFYALKNALRKDKVKTTITKITDLGLIEMTRKRTRESLSDMLSETCPYCNGKGHIKTPITVAFELFRELKRTFTHLNGRSIVVNVHPKVAQVLFNEARDRLDYLEKKFKKRIIVETVDSFHSEYFEISTRG